MFQLINNIIQEFRICFKREKTWRWFMIVVIGFMVRSNHRGITSILSSLRLEPRIYHKMLHFFKSTGYQVENLYTQWINIVMRKTEITQIADRVVLIGDHSKVSKEGQRMPDIQMLRQESQNSGKPGYIAGHNYGQVSAVITNGTVSRSIPLQTQLQISPPRNEKTKKPEGDSLVVQMMKLVQTTAQTINEPVVVALDAYFSSKYAWAATEQIQTQNGKNLIEIVTRAQTNTVAYTIPNPPTQKKRGKPRKYGDKMNLYSLFSDMSKFNQTTMVIYGKKTDVKYLCLDLLWKPVMKLVRFVVVETASGRCVLMSSDTSLTPQQIISIYALRFKIETSFDEQKNDMGCFDYHFWTTAMPKFKKWKKFEPPKDEVLQTRIDNTRKATQSFVCLSTIATGILTIIAFSHNTTIWNRYPGWIRTLRSSIPTVAIVKETLAQDLHILLNSNSSLPLLSFIRPLRRVNHFFYQDSA